MSWVKLDDGFTGHPKVMALSDRAFRLYIEALCYSSSQMTDGYIPREWVVRARPARKTLEELTCALWEECPSGFRIHDYLIYNPSRQQILDRRSQDSARKRNGLHADS